MIRNAQFNWERSLLKMTLKLLVTFYFAMLVVLPMKVYKTNLVTSHLIPVVMTSFNTAASLLLEPLINMHLTICHTLFKTNYHINFNIKRSYLSRGWVKNLPQHPLAPGRKTPGQPYHVYPSVLFLHWQCDGCLFSFPFVWGATLGYYSIIGTTGSCQ